jgi:integrase
LVNLQKPWRRLRDRATLAVWRSSDDRRLSKLIARLEAGAKGKVTAKAVAAAADFDLPPGLLDVRLHDLRHSFASVAVAGGEGLHMIGKLLGHTQTQTTHRYAHLAGDPMKAAADRIGNKIAAAMQGRAGQVISIGQKGTRL